MNQLVKYEAACRALAECKSFDEVKTIVNQAEAMRAYGRMAKDKTLEVDASEIRIRAERRLGEMLTQQKSEGGLNRGAAGIGPIAVVADDRNSAPTLGDAGISKDLSSRAQKLAAVPADEFEAELAAKREREQQDGARVTARLIQAGAKVLADEPLEDDGPSASELAAEAEAAEEDRIALQRLLEADDKLAFAMAEVKRLNALNAQLQQRVNGLMNEKNEAIRECKAAQRRLDRLERAAA